MRVHDSHERYGMNETLVVMGYPPRTGSVGSLIRQGRRLSWLCVGIRSKDVARESARGQTNGSNKQLQTVGCPAEAWWAQIRLRGLGDEAREGREGSEVVVDECGEGWCSNLGGTDVVRR